MTYKRGSNKDPGSDPAVVRRGKGLPEPAPATHKDMQDHHQRRMVVRQQLPKFYERGNMFQRSYSGFFLVRNNLVNMSRLFTDANLSLSDIACQASIFPEATNLQQLLNAVPSSIVDMEDEKALEVRLTKEQFSALKQFYSGRKEERAHG